MQNEHIRPRAVHFEDEVYVQNARTSSTNTTNSSAKTAPPSRPSTDTSGIGPQEEFGEDRCYECLAVGEDGEEDAVEAGLCLPLLQSLLGLLDDGGVLTRGLTKASHHKLTGVTHGSHSVQQSSDLSDDVKRDFCELFSK